MDHPVDSSENVLRGIGGATDFNIWWDQSLKRAGEQSN